MFQHAIKYPPIVKRQHVSKPSANVKRFWTQQVSEANKRLLTRRTNKAFTSAKAKVYADNRVHKKAS